jgi:hypothetical protein
VFEMVRKKKETNIPNDIAEKVTLYMNECGYVTGTINMKIGNLNFLFSHYGNDKMLKLLNSKHDSVYEAIEYIETTLPEGCIVSSDVQAFKLAWESLHRIEIIKKRVTKKGII